MWARHKAWGLVQQDVEAVHRGISGSRRQPWRRVMVELAVSGWCHLHNGVDGQCVVRYPNSGKRGADLTVRGRNGGSALGTVVGLNAVIGIA